MSTSVPKDRWGVGAAYEPYVGRWSRRIAREFLSWLNIPERKRWLDVGCGTGALTQTILEVAAPAAVRGVDQSAGFVEYTQAHTPDKRASFTVGDAQALPEESDHYDAVVSALMLNFVPRPELAAAEMSRVARADGTVAVYVWDYSGDMQMMRYFWDTASSLSPEARELKEGLRFPICNPEALSDLFRGAGLQGVEARAIDIPTIFKDFDDYWTPFLGGQGPAPSYVVSLSEDKRAELREHIRSLLPTSPDGSIHLVARAWAVKGTKPA
jgi:SAM-dependent methyltransferase